MCAGAGTLNATRTPATGLPFASVTTACTRLVAVSSATALSCTTVRDPSSRPALLPSAVSVTRCARPLRSLPSTAGVMTASPALIPLREAVYTPS